MDGPIPLDPPDHACGLPSSGGSGAEPPPCPPPGHSFFDEPYDLWIARARARVASLAAQQEAAEAPPAVTSLDPVETSGNKMEIAASPLNETGPLHRDYELIEDSPGTRWRHNSWKKIRRQVWEGLVRTKQSNGRRMAFAECGNLTTVEVANLDRNRVRLRTNCCHDRLCSPCAAGRSARIQQRLMEKIAEDKRATSFITLTLLGKGESLSDLVDRLYRSFRQLRDLRLWDDAVAGGAAFLEVKKNQNRWHPHLHIVCKAKYIPQAHLSDAWRAITRDSFIVWIERVQDQKKLAGYVTKYASKPLNSSLLGDDGSLDESINALKGRRLCLCFGTWYGTPLSLVEDEELADDEIDAGGWHFLMSLADMVKLAAGGDEEYQAMLTTLHAAHLLIPGSTGDPP